MVGHCAQAGWCKIEKTVPSKSLYLHLFLWILTEGTRSKYVTVGLGHGGYRTHVLRCTAAETTSLPGLCFGCALMGVGLFVMQ